MRLARRHSNVRAGVQTPVLRLYARARREFAEAGYVPVLPIGKSGGQARVTAGFGLHLFAAPEPDDVAKKLNVVCVEGSICPRYLPEQMSRINEEHLFAARPFRLSFVEEPQRHRQRDGEEHVGT